MQSAVDILTKLISSYGLFGVFVLMTLESLLIPIPSEVTMTFAGFLSGVGMLNFWWVVFLGALGNLIGSLIAFWLGYKLGEKWLRHFIKKYGKWFFVHENDFNSSIVWFKKYGNFISFFSRLLPIIRTYISLPAGISRMNIYLFSIYTFLGSFLWSLLLAFIGLKLGQNWHMVDPYFRKFQYLIIALCVLSLGIFVYIKNTKKNKVS